MDETEWEEWTQKLSNANYSRPPSVVWRYFKVSPCRTLTRCDICGSVLTFLAGSTGSMNNHLRLCHPGTIGPQRKRVAKSELLVSKMLSCAGRVDRVWT